MREFLAMLGKTNSNMGGKAAAAAYVFENATMSKSYPVDELSLIHI